VCAWIREGQRSGITSPTACCMHLHEFLDPDFLLSIYISLIVYKSLIPREFPRETNREITRYLDMSKDIELRLKWPPTINSYYQPIGRQRGIKRISDAGKAFRNAVIEDVHEQLGAGIWFNDRISLTTVLYPPDKRIRDLDNYMKALLDALTHAKLWEDDSLIDQHHIYRGVIIPKGLVHLHIADAGPLLGKDQIFCVK